MWKYVFIRIKRAPLQTMGIILFAAIMSAVLCGLHASNEAELRSFKETYRTIPVRFSVTNLTGTRSDNLNAPGWIADLFTGGSWHSPDLSGFVSDLQIKMVADISERDDVNHLVGLSSLAIANELRAENGGAVYWHHGYDETILNTDQMVCVVPQKMVAQSGNSEQIQELELKFVYTPEVVYTPEAGMLSKTKEYTCNLKVVGTYAGVEDRNIYCPYSVVEKVYHKLEKEREIDVINALLSNNEDLDKLRDIASQWFAEPNATGAKTEWNFADYDYFPFALDINDDLLQHTKQILHNSLTVNRICTMLIFMLSAGSGFFVCLLIVRSRKKEIALLRTVGASNGSIYLCLAAEQILCVVIGTILGGAYFFLQPAARLAMFVGIYFVGINAALLLSLHTNLLTSIKEDE